LRAGLFRSFGVDAFVKLRWIEDWHDPQVYYYVSLHPPRFFASLIDVYVLISCFYHIVVFRTGVDTSMKVYMFYRKYIFGLTSQRDKSPQRNSFQLVSKNFKVAIFEIIFGRNRTNELRTIQWNEIIEYQNIDFILYF